MIRTLWLGLLLARFPVALPAQEVTDAAQQHEGCYEAAVEAPSPGIPSYFRVHARKVEPPVFLNERGQRIPVSESRLPRYEAEAWLADGAMSRAVTHWVPLSHNFFALGGTPDSLSLGVIFWGQNPGVGELRVLGQGVPAVIGELHPVSCEVLPEG